MTKKRIAIFSSIGAGVGIASYATFAINPALGAAVPGLLIFAVCPAMCGAMGGAMWLQKRLSKKRSVTAAVATMKEGRRQQHSSSEMHSPGIAADDHHHKQQDPIEPEPKLLENKKVGNAVITTPKSELQSPNES
ncbi:MAG: hypothetical protein ACREAZ_12410 [Nitrososphaera sp.]